jgi:hypothetical protein
MIWEKLQTCYRGRETASLCLNSQYSSARPSGGGGGGGGGGGSGGAGGGSGAGIRKKTLEL